MGHSSFDPVEQGPAWNAGRKLGAKRPLKPKEIWEIRFMLDREHRLWDRALFDLAIDSKLRGCDLVRVRIGDLVSGGRVRNRAMVYSRRRNDYTAEELAPMWPALSIATGYTNQWPRAVKSALRLKHELDFHRLPKVSGYPKYYICERFHHWRNATDEEVAFELERSVR